MHRDMAQTLADDAVERQVVVLFHQPVPAPVLPRAPGRTHRDRAQINGRIRGQQRRHDRHTATSITKWPALRSPHADRKEDKKRALLKRTTPKVTNSMLGTMIGCDPKTIQRIRNKPKHNLDNSTRQELWKAISGQDVFPWETEVGAQIGVMSDLVRNGPPGELLNAYKFSGTDSLDVVRELDQCGRADLTPRELAHLLVAYYWILSFINMRVTVEIKPYVKDYPLIINVWRRYLDSLEDVPWATVFRGRISMNEFGGRWSSMSADERESEAIRREVESKNHIKAMMDYGETMENADATHNALAIASRLNQDKYYRELGQRLMEAFDYSTLEKFETAIENEYKNSNEEDAKDFRNFFVWAKKHGFPNDDESKRVLGRGNGQRRARRRRWTRRAGCASEIAQGAAESEGMGEEGLDMAIRPIV